MNKYLKTWLSDLSNRLSIYPLLHQKSILHCY